jgi:hypothetical protein
MQDRKFGLGFFNQINRGYSCPTGTWAIPSPLPSSTYVQPVPERFAQQPRRRDRPRPAIPLFERFSLPLPTLGTTGQWAFPFWLKRYFYAQKPLSPAD